MRLWDFLALSEMLIKLFYSFLALSVQIKAGAGGANPLTPTAGMTQNHSSTDHKVAEGSWS